MERALRPFPIATDVSGRSADFDPQNDSIVRGEMGRVRQALDTICDKRRE